MAGLAQVVDTWAERSVQMLQPYTGGRPRAHVHADEQHRLLEDPEDSGRESGVSTRASSHAGMSREAMQRLMEETARQMALEVYHQMEGKRMMDDVEEFNTAHKLEGEGVLELELPSNMYSMVIQVALRQNLREFSRHQCVGYTPVFLGMGAAWFIQIFVLYELRCIVLRHSSSECLTDTNMLRFLCGSIFSIQMCTELQETLHMFQWVRLLKHSESMEVMVYDPATREPITGVTACCRRSIYFGLLVPKVLISLALLFFGGGHIATSTSREEMILNCLAMTFIIDVDEIMMKFVISQFWKKKITLYPLNIKHTMPPNKEDVRRLHPIVLEYCSGWIAIVCLVITVTCMQQWWCH